jgi:subtilisin family serine protease
MVNLEELSKEDQRKYTELQEYIKKQFLSSAENGHLGKVTIADFELLTIKLNKDKFEVIPTIIQPPSDLVTQFSVISDNFDRAFNDQNSFVASVITRLEKVEDKRISSDIPDDFIPQVDSQGVLQPNLSTVSGTSMEAPIYGMTADFFPRQSPLSKTLVRPPLMTSITTQAGRMVTISEQPVPLSVVHSTLIYNHSNVMVPPAYSRIAHTSPPTPNTSPPYGIPNDVLPTFTIFKVLINPL